MAISRTKVNALVDDDGSGIVGTPVVKQRFVDIYDDIDAMTTDAAWTPTLVSSGGGTPTYSVQVGGYIKANRHVRFWGHIALATKGTLAAGSLSIGGLPVAAVGTANLYGQGIAMFFAAMTTPIVWMSGYVVPGSSALTLQMLTAAAVGTSPITVADVSATVDIGFSGAYLSAT